MEQEAVESSEIRMMKKIFILSVFFLCIVALINFVSAAETNISVEQQAVLCFSQSKQDMKDMQNENFSVLRVNDSIKQMSDLFNAQIVLKEKGSAYDFSPILKYCDEIASIKKTAFISRDDFIALEKFYLESVEGINTSSIDIIMSEIQQEIANERYEKVGPLVDKAYQEIVNQKSRQTTLNVFYESTTRSIGKFIYKNRYMLIGLILLIAIMIVVYKKAIARWLIKRKINKLELRKKTLKDLIMKTQREYFNEGRISEGTFNIKTKKLAELIRDIERQLPLLQEELLKLNWQKKNKEDKK